MKCQGHIVFSKQNKTSCSLFFARSHFKVYVNKKSCDQNQPIRWLIWVTWPLTHINVLTFDFFSFFKLLAGHWYPCFGFLVKSPLGFKARVGSALDLIAFLWRRMYILYYSILEKLRREIGMNIINYSVNKYHPYIWLIFNGRQLSFRIACVYLDLRVLFRVLKIKTLAYFKSNDF